MIRFKEGGWWFPDGEAHLQDWILKMTQPCHGRWGYQKHKYDLALALVRDPGVAVDVGAHVGLWSWPMSHDFGQVISFEPMREHRECFGHNLAGRDNVTLHACALGAENGIAHLRTRTPGSSGDTGVDSAAERSSLRGSIDDAGEQCPLHTLDSFELQRVDLLKIDCEGYELFVLQGAVETLKRCRPVCVVEQKPETGGAQRYGIGVTDGVTFLEGLGAKRRRAVQGDYILSWD